MQGDIIDQGVELMLYGMGTVVVFLTVLIFTTSFMSWFLGRYFPEAEIAVMSPGRTPSAAPQQVEDQARLVAVITAAIHRHRAEKK